MAAVVREKLFQYCQASIVLGTTEQTELDRCVEAVKAHVLQKVHTLVKEANQKPLLVSFSADPTPHGHGCLGQKHLADSLRCLACRSSTR